MRSAENGAVCANPAEAATEASSENAMRAYVDSDTGRGSVGIRKPRVFSSRAGMREAHRL